jgi:small conductance mechanosensitive channel
LAFVFQGLLRDFFAGLVVLLEDVGVLVTSLRCLDQRVVVIPNSRCDRLVNHTRIRSGVEVLIPLPPANPQLNKPMELVNQEVQAFAADPEWQALLLAQPDVRGVKRVTPIAVELTVVLINHVGDQWAAERALLGRIVQRLEREGVPLAQVQAMTAG